MNSGFFTRGYRRKIWARRYIRLEDLLQVILAIITGTFAVNTWSVSRTVTTIAGLSYFFLLAILIYRTYKSREAKDRVQAEVLWGLFSHMNQIVFNNDNRVRFTFFIRDSVRRNYIVPWYRFEKAGDDPISDAQESLARYKKGEGTTGEAWEQTGELILRSFPKFKSRSAFVKYYVDELDIDKEIVDEISPHMENIRTMITYGFTDPRGKFLGVLSIDLKDPISPEESAETGLAIDANSLALVLRSVHNVLESFSVIQKNPAARTF